MSAQMGEEEEGATNIACSLDQGEGEAKEAFLSASSVPSAPLPSLLLLIDTSQDRSHALMRGHGGGGQMKRKRRGGEGEDPQVKIKLHASQIMLLYTTTVATTEDHFFLYVREASPTSWKKEGCCRNHLLSNIGRAPPFFPLEGGGGGEGSILNSLGSRWTDPLAWKLTDHSSFFPPPPPPPPLLLSSPCQRRD